LVASQIDGFGDLIAHRNEGSGRRGSQGGMTMSGAYAGAGSWRIDFITDGVMVNCSFLSPNQETYSVKFAGGSTQG